MSRYSYIGLVFLLGCASQQPPGAQPDAGPTSNPVVPKVGVWHYAQLTPVTTTCNSNVMMGQGGDFAIDAASVSGIHINPNDGTAPFACTLSNGAFDCPNRAAAMQDERPAYDVVVTIHATASGTFSDATHATGSQHATVDCTGTQCALVGPFPCTYSQNFTIIAL